MRAKPLNLPRPSRFTILLYTNIGLNNFIRVWNPFLPFFEKRIVHGVFGYPWECLKYHISSSPCSNKEGDDRNIKFLKKLKLLNKLKKIYFLLILNFLKKLKI